MAFARDVSTASASQTDFTISFPYIAEADVVVSVDGVTKTQGSGNDYIFSDSTTIQFNSGLTGGETVILQRKTSQSSRLVTYTAGELSEADLNNDSLQAFYMAQEAIDTADTALGLDTDDLWTAESKRIKNVDTPTASTDAANKSYVDQAALGTIGTPLAVADGGTGSATASAARTALGVAIGSDVQAYDADTAKLDVSQTWSAHQNWADNRLQRPVLLDYGELVNAIGSIGGGTQDIDLTLGNVVSATVDTSTTTFTFSNPPASGTEGGFKLYLTNGGSQTVNWPAAVDWDSGTAPTLTAAGVDVLVFTTIDGGTIWNGFLAGTDMS